MWFTGTEGHFSGGHIAGPQAGHSWEAADPGAREGAVDTAGLALAACLWELRTRGNSCLFWDEADDTCGQTSSPHGDSQAQC